MSTVTAKPVKFTHDLMSTVTAEPVKFTHNLMSTVTAEPVIYSQSYVDSHSEGFLKVLLELNNPVQFSVELSFFVEQLISQLPPNLQ